MAMTPEKMFTPNPALRSNPDTFRRRALSASTALCLLLGASWAPSDAWASKHHKHADADDSTANADSANHKEKSDAGSSDADSASSKKSKDKDTSQNTSKDASSKPLSSADILAHTKPEDWQALDPANTLYMDTAQGRVVILLAPGFAPEHVANLRILASEHYFDGLAITRVQENYVVQWGDPTPDNGPRKSLGSAKVKLPAEFTQPIKANPFTKLSDGDVYAPEVGWSNGFPTARDPKKKQAWLVHCYSMVGAGRDVAPDSSNGSELYVVISQAPRHLDRNMTMVGRVVSGMENLSALPRGKGPLGFYQTLDQMPQINSLRLASEVPDAERTPLEMLRTDTDTWKAWVESRRNRHEDFFVEALGHIDLCNVPLPVRKIEVSNSTPKG